MSLHMKLESSRISDVSAHTVLFYRSAWRAPTLSEYSFVSEMSELVKIYGHGEIRAGMLSLSCFYL